MGPIAAKQARRALDQLLQELPEACLDDIRLLVSELVTNSLRHAGMPSDAAIGLRAEVTEDAVRVEVVDSGPGFEPHHVDPSIYQTSGWGLYLVEQIADRWGVERSADTLVWFEFDRSGGPGGFSRCA